jgi:LmbE family N-acetylglucosaminyl deacetylase
MGVESARITTAVDVGAYIEQKRRAMRAHASQIAETSWFLAMPDETFRAVWGTEWYIRVGAASGRPLEDELTSSS